jgi:late competence protein required for DNA uptake (superfamily II DNA/RNA helicase)
MPDLEQSQIMLRQQSNSMLESSFLPSPCCYCRSCIPATTHVEQV